MTQPVTIAVVGAGMRGETYSRFAMENPGRAKVVATNDQSKVLSGPDETLAGHRTVFVAEQARRESRVVDIREFVPGRCC